ncbi:hypothetical protein [Ideonella paludis]|uniref:Uncharacterized protein n=1 Tax=Ideonella paludis TaxID=1233411 RepID=A0ABS5E0B9_9BURK|nr:hypothetical protein [Ideonella paludis]MBQ0936838.1 hypothetical protein [Ideonella paludis]
MSAAKDQGSRDTCAAFPTNAQLEAAIRRDLGQSVVVSEEFAFYLARRSPWNGPDESMPIDPFVDGAIEVGSLPEPDRPYRLELPPGCTSSASVTPSARAGMKTSSAPRPCRAPVPPHAWGRTWGREGFGWISFEDMDSALVMGSGFVTASDLPKEKTFGLV